MDRILMRHDGHHPVDRAQLCSGTIAILDAWTAVSLIPASKDSRFAKARMVRDILYDRLMNPMEFARLPACHLLSRMQQSLLTDPTLAPLHLSKGEVSDAARWIYRTGGGKFAKHRVFRQPFSYPVLARDGVSTLHPSFSQDNYHLYGGLHVSSVPSTVSPLSSLPINKATASNERFHPYARPRTIEHPPLALLDEDPSFPLLEHDPSFPCLNEHPLSPSSMKYHTVSKTSASNELTLDELIEEAKNNSAIMGYTEAMNRGLLRRKGSRVQWVSDSPATTEREQVDEDATIQGPPVQVSGSLASGVATAERDHRANYPMSQIPQSQGSESLPSRSMTAEHEQVAEDAIEQTPPVQVSEDVSNKPPTVEGDTPQIPQSRVLEKLPKEPKTVEREQVAEDVILQTPQVQNSKGVLIALSTAKHEQLAYDTMSQIPQVLIYEGVPSIASPDDEPFEHVRYLDSGRAKQ